MGLTGFNRQRKRALLEIVDDKALVDKLYAHGICYPDQLKAAKSEDLAFLTEEEIAKCNGEEPKPIQDLNVKPLKKKVSETDDVKLLEEWLEVETNNQDRKSAKEAIQSRIDELTEEEEPEEEESSNGESEDDTEDQDPESEKDSEEEPDDKDSETKQEDESPSNEEEAGKEIKSFEDIPEGADFPFGYGGGMFYLSNGEKVRGQIAAEKAQEALENNEG